MRGDRERVARLGVAGQDDLAPLALRPHDLLGRDAVDRLAALQAAEVGAGLDAEARCELRVEMAGARSLDDRVAERRRGSVADWNRGDQVAVALHRLGPLELDALQLVPQ